ncbi:histidine kinase N-terminal 7TM domain-containing protein [Papillibacter cinnamivorans]|nr:histidine kinase N-terminal 7TM domain-containing protein [Papillibacter cinnamivorans]
MDLTFAYETYYLVELQIASIFLLVTVNTAIWMKAKKIPLLYSYLSVQGALLLWMTAKILKNVSPTVELKFLFVVIQYVGICSLGVLFFAFAFYYAKGRFPAGRTLAVLSVFPFITLLILSTNPLHHLFYSRFDFWGDSFGPAFYAHQAYHYVLIAGGILLCGKNYFHQFGEKRLQAVLFSVAILVPLIANILYVFGWVEPLFGFSPPCDITPIACNISLFMFALAVFRYRFFDDLKITWRAAMDLHPDGILLLDGSGRVSDYNSTFQTLFEGGQLFARNPSDSARRPSEASVRRFQTAGFPAGKTCFGSHVYETETGGFIRMKCGPVENRGRHIGTFLQFSDATLRQMLLKESEKRNEALSRLNRILENEAGVQRALIVTRRKNYIAREVHDILGHSVVLAITILETARMSPAAGDELAQSIRNAMEPLKNSIKRNPARETPDGENSGGLRDMLSALKEDAEKASVSVEISISGRLPELASERAEAAYKVCREGVTNAIRHGGADRVDIILRNAGHGLEIYVMDNGSGCGKIVKGMGLSGMEERLAPLGGRLEFSSPEEGGFSLRAFLPFI